MKLKTTLLLILVAATIGAACVASPPALPSGIVRDPPPDVSDVSLPDAANADRAFTTRAGSGALLLVYFGYTSCPDVCPTTLADLRRAVQRLGDDAGRIDVAMITVDPDRDDAQRLTAYVQSFFDGAHALRTDDAGQLLAAADAFGASYEVSQSEDGDVDVAHSAFLYAVDADGLIRLQWPFGVTSDDLYNDLVRLIEERT
ncbi:MAG: SCO family protein [Acidimicrobiia bacterium]|nr:SCO family protein [Acidimicrobiia bacterium]